MDTISTRETQASGKRTVLVVDDTPENLGVLAGILQADYRVRAANSGARALQAATSAPRPDIILLDVMMPEMDGHEVLRRLREDPDTRDTPVIFVTAMDATEDEEKGFALGAVDYITKPVKPALVLARVRAHLELKQARDWLKDQNAYLESEIARRMAENLMIQDVSIQTLANLAETRDLETGNHIRRTQLYVETLARRLARSPHLAAELTPRRIGLIADAAPLHDIGKVGIPDSILLKPGKLTDAEWVIMRRHAWLGGRAIEEAIRQALDSLEEGALESIAGDLERDRSRLLARALAGDSTAPLAFLGIAKQIAHRHHEKWDGSGYPDGLAGHDIPLPARLMALADVFDALISRRVYKDPMPVDKAVAIIVEGKGKHFDPEVVEAFLLELDEFRAIAERYADTEETLKQKAEKVAGMGISAPG